MNSKRVLVVGSAEQSGGGVASVIRLMKWMPVWEKYNCYWLGTQIQAGKWVKLWYAIKAYVIATFIIWRYDIVHFHTVPDRSMTVQLPVLLLALIGRKKIILHIHCGNQLAMEMCTKDRIAHWCMGKADKIVLLANSFRPLLDEFWPEAKAECSVIYNALDLKEGGCDNLKKPTVLFAGIFNDNKSADVLVEAFAKIHKNNPEWRLQLLGSGPNEDDIRKQIHKLGIEDYVDMPGYVFGDEKERYFREASIYVMCSKYEGFPVVVLEAWAHGVCVVTTPVGAMPDFTQDGDNCLSFPFGNVEVLSKQMERLIVDERLRNHIADYSMHFVKDNFSLKKINADLERLYQDLN